MIWHKFGGTLAGWAFRFTGDTVTRAAWFIVEPG